MNELVSIIVPVRNNVKYLEACVHSILRQTYKNMEIIIIDDASEAACAELCDTFSCANVFVKHLKNPGGGVSCKECWHRYFEW